uniref:Uncharacterized protein n=1 Tax=Anguilla anguilla TaxID=7936 RepID=A0A0E9PX16_ANGAN
MLLRNPPLLGGLQDLSFETPELDD